MSIELALQHRVARGDLLLVPLPRVVQRFRALMQDPHRSVVQVVETVRECSLLTAAVLRAADAATPGEERRPDSLSAAVSRTPKAELLRLALASQLASQAGHEEALLEVRERAQQDALASALLCRLLAPEFDLPPGPLFLAGLLHDVGRLVALGTMEVLLAEHPETPARSPTQWLALADLHHVELGLTLAARWRLPGDVRTAIERHHQPGAGEIDATAVVRASEALLAQLREGGAAVDARDPLLDRLSDEQKEATLVGLEQLPAALETLARAEPSPWLAAFAGSRPSMMVATPSVGRARLHRGLECELSSVSASLLRVVSPVRLRENHLEELELMLPGVPLKLVARVTHASLPDALGRHHTELVPFALTREHAEVLEGFSALLSSRGAA